MASFKDFINQTSDGLVDFKDASRLKDIYYSIGAISNNISRVEDDVKNASEFVYGYYLVPGRVLELYERCKDSYAEHKNAGQFRSDLDRSFKKLYGRAQYFDSFIKSAKTANKKLSTAIVKAAAVLERDMIKFYDNLTNDIETSLKESREECLILNGIDDLCESTLNESADYKAAFERFNNLQKQAGNAIGIAYEPEIDNYYRISLIYNLYNFSSSVERAFREAVKGSKFNMEVFDNVVNKKLKICKAFQLSDARDVQIKKLCAAVLKYAKETEDAFNEFYDALYADYLSIIKK